MGIAPGSLNRPLAPVMSQPRLERHDLIIFHTVVGSLSSAYAYFKQQGYRGTESHHIIGYDGTDYQTVDYDFRADANLEANDRAISFETADYGPGFPKWDTQKADENDVPAWTEAQVKRLIVLTTFYCRKFNIPPVLIPDSKPGRRGIGYHRQGIDGNLPDMRVSGGQKWSTARGKICPGNKRIKQLKEIIIPAVKKALDGPVTPPPVTPPKEPTMAVTNEDLMRQLVSTTKLLMNTANNVAALMSREAKSDVVTNQKLDKLLKSQELAQFSLDESVTALSESLGPL